MNSRIKPIMRFFQAGEKSLVVILSMEYPPPSTTTVHHVVKRIFILNSWRSGHTSYFYIDTTHYHTTTDFLFHLILYITHLTPMMLNC